MGLKNKLNKMKSFLFDDDEEEKVEPKKEKYYREKFEAKQPPKIEEEIHEEKKQMEDLYFEDISDNNDSSSFESRSTKKEPEFKFPEFSDDDFLVAKKEEIKEAEPVKIPEKKEEIKVPLYQGSRRKEEVKKFKPSPIISPIYGLLDDEGNRIKKEDKIDNPYYNKKEEMTFDDIRKKAYGALDEELGNTLKRLNNKTIEEAEKEYEEEKDDVTSEVKLSRQAKNSHKEVKKVKKASIKNDEEDDDDDEMILPNINLKEINVNKNKNSKYDEEDEEDTKEQDLFNLIDSMYANEEKK